MKFKLQWNKRSWTCKELSENLITQWNQLLSAANHFKIR